MKKTGMDDFCEGNIRQQIENILNVEFKLFVHWERSSFQN